MAPNFGSSITVDYINSTVAVGVANKESVLRSMIGKLGDSPSTGDLLMLQQSVTQWTMMTSIQSTLVKEISDCMKGIIQKSG
ncbi:MAG: EscF/YscF/HrpA family type III secretion system needle major subunit [Ramlibacter sp.]